MPNRGQPPRTSECYQEKFMKVMLLRSKTLKRVIYLECGKDFADILLSLLIMPIGAVLKVLDDAGLATDLNKGLFNLYASLKNLEQSTLGVQKHILTDPNSAYSSPFLCIEGPTDKSCINSNCTNSTAFENQLCDSCERVTWLKCKHCSKCYATSTQYCCGGYGKLKEVVVIQEKANQTASDSATSCKSPANGTDAGKGFVKENITFMIKEDLSIIKSCTITSISLLQSMKVSDFHDLDTKQIDVGRKEGLLLVRAALVSNQPLTDVFEPYFV